MFTMWIRKIKKGKMLDSLTITIPDPDLNRTRKVYKAIEDMCRQWDLSSPIWLDMNISDFKHHSKTRFGQDNFIDEIDFDFIEITMLEEDV
jgi:hypothetical protein